MKTALAFVSLFLVFAFFGCQHHAATDAFIERLKTADSAEVYFNTKGRYNQLQVKTVRYVVHHPDTIALLAESPTLLRGTENTCQPSGEINFYAGPEKLLGAIIFKLQPGCNEVIFFNDREQLRTKISDNAKQYLERIHRQVVPEDKVVDF